MSPAPPTQQTSPPGSLRERVAITVEGVVQGVGFRPFVHRVATDLRLSGLVGNDARCVFIEVEGPARIVAEFTRRVRDEAPPMAFVTALSSRRLRLRGDGEFRIVASADADGARTLVPPDVATCEACLGELFDPRDRRYRHPFITCTDCGPRLTIIRDLPYDRPATTMASFVMCPACAAEYADPADRRFHAQPIACHDCGPRLAFESDGTSVARGDEAVGAAQRALAAGAIVAIKGVGGYHLACHADDDAAIARLRARKSRDEKPFALLVRDVATAQSLVELGADERTALTGRPRPIVLLHRRRSLWIADGVAPGNPLLGLMLPYTPLHHLLLAPVPDVDADPPAVLVLTSANVSDEPLCFDDVDARARLPLLADAVLTHDRPIHVPCDDSVVRVIDGHELPIRRSRGFAPLPVPLGRPTRPTLAVGGELKNTCCIIDGTNAFCSAHVGDMGSIETIRAFERAASQLMTLHRLAPEVVAADAHPGYLTRDWAERHAGHTAEPELRTVQHHHAHVVSLIAERGLLGAEVLGVAFDGTGYGDDGTVWGGEFLLVGPDATSYERVGHLRTVDLPGGDGAVRNPCRTAIAYLQASGIRLADDLPPVAACTSSELAAVASQLRSRTGTVACSSMGRLFDAVASLLGVRHRIGYEAQAAIELEILAEQGRSDLPPTGRFTLSPDGVLDYGPVLRHLVAGLRAGVARSTLAAHFHSAVADGVVQSAMRVFPDGGTVGLTGGVFQNVLLLRECRDRLAALGMHVLVHSSVPPNDGGLALGQAVVAALVPATRSPRSNARAEQEAGTDHDR